MVRVNTAKLVYTGKLNSSTMDSVCTWLTLDRGGALMILYVKKLVLNPPSGIEPVESVRKGEAKLGK